MSSIFIVWKNKLLDLIIGLEQIHSTIIASIEKTHNESKHDIFLERFEEGIKTLKEALEILKRYA